MSSLTRETKSRTGWRLRAYTATGRKSIWLGDIPEADAVAVQRHVDEILAAQTADLPLPRQTVRWLDQICPALRRKLSAILGATHTVGTAIDAYVTETRERLALATWNDRQRSLELLRETLDQRPIDRVSTEDVTECHQSLTVGESTRGKIAAGWRAFFRWCIDRKLIADNPARELSTKINVREKHFVPVGVAAKLIEIATPAMAVAIAMSRFGGIRVPSELRSLTWDAVDWDRKRITICDHKRNTTRTIPLFPEIAAALARHPRDVPLCGDLIDGSDSGMACRLLNLMAIAGVTPWRAPWHSMRATRETELIEQYGLATASQWVGNSAAVAMRSYAMVTDEHWRTATDPHL
jgi:integrase